MKKKRIEEKKWKKYFLTFFESIRRKVVRSVPRTGSDGSFEPDLLLT